MRSVGYPLTIDGVGKWSVARTSSEDDATNLSNHDRVTVSRRRDHIEERCAVDCPAIDVIGDEDVRRRPY
jgi:hypothetical protein